MPASSRIGALGDDEYATLAAFRHALRRFLHFSEGAARGVGLTAQQYQALLALRGAPEAMSVNDLAGQLFIKHHSAVGLVDRLVAQALVERRPSSDDRRKVELRLTPKGERVLERLAGQHRSELDRVGPELRALLRQIAS